MRYGPETIEYKVSDNITLGVKTFEGFGYKEVSIDIIKNGVRTPLVLAGNDIEDGDDVVYVYLYNEHGDEPELIHYDTNKSDCL